jgi:hypothetical protein
MMHTAITLSSRIELPSETEPSETDTERYRGKYGDEYIKKMLTSIEEAKKELPKQTFQQNLF